MGIFNKFVGFVKSFFGRKGQNAPPVTKHPSQPIVSVHDMLNDFLYFHKPLVRLSSNVAYMRFDWVNNTLRVGYSNGAVWEYGDWKIEEIEELITDYQSSGKFVWDKIRKRASVFGSGKKHKHQRPARRIN